MTWPGLSHCVSHDIRLHQTAPREHHLVVLSGRMRGAAGEPARYAADWKMSTYQNFTVDLPERLAILDRKFRPIASDDDLDVSYALMKLAASFLLPYERIKGTSGARRADIRDSQSIRKFLELDKRFHEASYCSDIAQWSCFDVAGFSRGPSGWLGNERQLDLPAHEVLQTIRHSVAHSNLFFGGEVTIEHIYLGSRRERDPETGKYRVVRCTAHELHHFVDAWISNVQKLRVSPSLIWRELEVAA